MTNVKYILTILGQILFYYCCSISLTFFNKWCFSRFHFPLIMSFFQMSIMAHIIWLYRGITKPSGKDTVSWETFIKRVCPTAITASMDIGLSNWSFMYITVSMYTMCKSTSIIFILLAAILFRIEKPKLMSAVVIGLISVGLILFTYKATSFNLFGFIIVMSASAISGLRWVLAQILLQRDNLGLRNTLDFVYYVNPVMVATIMPLAIAMEGSDMLVAPNFMLAERGQQLYILVVVLISCVLALFLTFSEYILLSNTSSITLSISGIVKEIATLGLASTVGGDTLSTINIAGLVVCITGISLHVYMKWQTTQLAESKSGTQEVFDKNMIEMDDPVATVERRGLLDSEEESCHESDL